ncbi:MAG: hypothetical protein QMD01_01470 [Thermodesulfovibrionales bacterium]|nr:hypothetical protein [Thermodesulfovibrionales bacterium]
MYTLFEHFKDFAEKYDITGNAFIVGGAVRDIMSGKELKDIDIALKGDALGIAKKFSKEIGASFVLLDSEFGISRVVKKGFFIDICLMRGDSIYTDLADRDITINAMALPLTEVREQRTDDRKQRTGISIIDPYNGKDDLSNKIIRMVSEENLIKDPLRILRIYRFAATLNFHIEEKTHNTVKRLASLITSPAGERIAEELRHIIKVSDSCKTIGSMMLDGILLRIVPEIAEMSDTMLPLYKNIEDAINEEPFSRHLTDNYKKLCLKLSALFADSSSAKKASMRLKMSKKETEFIHSMVSSRIRILSLRKEIKGAPDAEEVIMLLKKFKDDIYSLAISGMAADPSAARFWREVIAFYHEKIKPRMALLPIITGDDLIERFGLNPSPLFKKIISEIEDSVLLGIITSKEEALKTASEIIKK